MKFHSLGQYFYRLYALLFALILIPLGVFIFLYQALQVGILPQVDLSLPAQHVIYVIGGVVITVWLLSYIIFFRRVRAIRKIFSLGDKLSRYATLTIVRSVMFSIGLLVLIIGYYFTESQWLTIAFIASLVIPLLFWPVPARVCNHLKLKGDERMMVLYKMDDL